MPENQEPTVLAQVAAYIADHYAEGEIPFGRRDVEKALGHLEEQIWRRDQKKWRRSFRINSALDFLVKKGHIVILEKRYNATVYATTPELIAGYHPFRGPQASRPRVSHGRASAPYDGLPYTKVPAQQELPMEPETAPEPTLRGPQSMVEYENCLYEYRGLIALQAVRDTVRGMLQDLEASVKEYPAADACRKETILVATQAKISSDVLIHLRLDRLNTEDLT